jgi:hypothetical protein
MSSVIVKNYLYEARIMDEESGKVICRVFSYSYEGLEEEMGKSKWTDTIKEYEETDKLKNTVNNMKKYD